MKPTHAESTDLGASGDNKEPPSPLHAAAGAEINIPVPAFFLQVVLQTSLKLLLLVEKGCEAPQGRSLFRLLEKSTELWQLHQS